MKIKDVLIKHSIVGVAGNRSSGKTSLILSLFKDLRSEFSDLNICVLGTNSELDKVLSKYNITILKSKMDILDLRLKDSVIFVDEFATLFDSQTRSKQLTKLMRFFDRIEHQNCKLIIGTAREGFFNKFMCSRINCFLIKTMEYDALVNGTWLKERVKAINSSSDYRIEMEKNEFFVVSNNESLTTKHKFKYIKEFDTKKNNVNLFEKKRKKK